MASMMARTKVQESVTSCARRLGYENVKDDQRRVIASFVEGNDVIVCFPTGYGKSFCFFVLPYIFDDIYSRNEPWSVVIVVSPLQSLMHDQVLSLRSKGVAAVIAGNDNGDTVKADIVNGRFQVVYTTPELLLSDRSWTDVFRSPSLCERLVALVIDEAHCVKKW